MIGPWTHTAPGLLAAGIREGLGWLRARLLDDDRLVGRAPVRVFVTGERAGGGWRELPSWPPPGTGERRLWLAADGSPPGGSAPHAADGADRYRYDPAIPRHRSAVRSCSRANRCSTTARSRPGPTC